MKSDGNLIYIIRGKIPLLGHTYRQGLHHWLCWSTPYRARHFFGLLQSARQYRIPINLTSFPIETCFKIYQWVHACCLFCIKKKTKNFLFISKSKCACMFIKMRVRCAWLLIKKNYLIKIPGVWTIPLLGVPSFFLRFFFVWLA